MQYIFLFNRYIWFDICRIFSNQKCIKRQFTNTIWIYVFYYTYTVFFQSIKKIFFFFKYQKNEDCLHTKIRNDSALFMCYKDKLNAMSNFCFHSSSSSYLDCSGIPVNYIFQDFCFLVFAFLHFSIFNNVLVKNNENRMKIKWACLYFNNLKRLYNELIVQWCHRKKRSWAFHKKGSRTGIPRLRQRLIKSICPKYTVDILGQ